MVLTTGDTCFILMTLENGAEFAAKRDALPSLGSWLFSEGFVEFSKEHENHYDAADGFRNNYFEGAWQSYLG
jgi:hypothetical protein